MIKDTLKITGEVQFLLYDEAGILKETRSHNMIVGGGKNLVASRLSSNTESVVTHIGVGSLATAVSASDTALAAQIVRSILTTAGGTLLANTVTYSTSMGPGVGTGSIVEAGLFNASSGGTLFARTTFAAISKSALDTLVINWKITVN